MPQGVKKTACQFHFSFTAFNSANLKLLFISFKLSSVHKHWISDLMAVLSLLPSRTYSNTGTRIYLYSWLYIYTWLFGAWVHLLWKKVCRESTQLANTIKSNISFLLHVCSKPLHHGCQRCWLYLIYSVCILMSCMYIIDHVCWALLNIREAAKTRTAPIKSRALDTSILNEPELFQCIK